MSATVTTLISTIAGDLAVSEGMAFYLSPCCHASAKGCDGYVGCRACYAPIDARLGDAWMVRDEAAWERFVAFLVESVGLPREMALRTMISVAKAAA